METKPLHLAKIKVESWLQPRDSLDAEAIADYTRIFKSCKESPFPPWRVFLIDDKYYLTRGFHREVAAKAANQSTHTCEVVKGTRQEALIDAASSNAENGVRRTNKDKRRAVLMLLTNKDAPEWTNRFIANCTHTTHSFVNLVAKELAGENGKAAKRSTRKKKKKKKADGSGHPDENKPDLTPVERMAEMNNDIESLCRGVLKMYDDGIAPLHCKNLWLIYEDRVAAARSKIDSACNTIRQAKGKAICAACEGEGCDKCKSAGYIPRQMVEHLQ